MSSYLVYDFLQVRTEFVNRLSTDAHRAIVRLFNNGVVFYLHRVHLSQDGRPVSVHRCLPVRSNAASAIASETVSKQSRSSAVCHPALYSRLPIAWTLSAFSRRFWISSKACVRLLLASGNSDEFPASYLEVVPEYHRDLPVGRHCHRSGGFSNGFSVCAAIVSISDSSTGTASFSICKPCCVFACTLTENEKVR